MTCIEGQFVVPVQEVEIYETAWMAQLVLDGAVVSAGATMRNEIGAGVGQNTDKKPEQRGRLGQRRKVGRRESANGEDRSFRLCQACRVQVPTCFWEE